MSTSATAVAVAMAPEPSVALAGYLDYVAGLDCAQQAKSLRRWGAARFLERFEDLDPGWPAPLGPARRFDPCPRVAVRGLAVRDRAPPRRRGSDCRPRQRLPLSTCARLHREDVDRAVAAGRQLGWGAPWIDQVCVIGLALVCVTAGATLDHLDAQVFAATAAALDAAPSVSSNHRRVLHGRLRALQ